MSSESELFPLSFIVLGRVIADCVMCRSIQIRQLPCKSFLRNVRYPLCPAASCGIMFEEAHVKM